MPVHAWNWFRAVGVGNDLKSWYGDNPQVEDGREGGNQEFDDDVSGQYEDEVNFMMRRLRLNFYRAEDMMLIYMKRKWAVRLRISLSLLAVLSVELSAGGRPGVQDRAGPEEEGEAREDDQAEQGQEDEEGS